MNKITNVKLLVTRNAYALGAGVMLFAAVLAGTPFSQVSAVQLTARSVQMSDSGPSANSNITTGVGSGTNVAYKFQFSTTNTSQNIGGIVIDFCSNSALSGDTCTAPTGLNTNKSSTTISNASGTGTGAFSVNTSDSGTGNASRIILTRGTAAPLTSTVSFELGNGTSNGITNPSTTGTFYARIYTYDSASAANSHSSSSASGFKDFGAVALSTANVITITARVQESLIFCVSAASPTSNCGGTTTPAVTLGHVGTGAVKYLDSSAIDTGIVYSQLSTNAGSGATIRIHNSNNTCGGLSLDGGTSCGIPPTRSGAATSPNAGNTGAMTAGTAAFGLAVTAGTGLTSAAPYDGAAASNYYGMDSTTSGSNVTTTYGSSVLTAAGPVNNINSTWNFAATASNVTPAGLYSANVAAIATGQF